MGIGIVVPRNLEVARSNSSTSQGASAAQFPINIRNTDTTTNNWASIGFNQGASSLANAVTVGAQFQDTTQGSFVVYTSGVERLRLPYNSSVLVLNGGTSSTGTGIAFPASQSASSDANTLDDYEEGTFTPTITPSGGAFTTLSNVFGTYTKTGNVVNISITYTITTIGTASGAAIIGNLPFAGTANRFAGVTREIAVNGFGGSVYFNSSTTLNQDIYNGGSPIVAGAYWLINLQYNA